MIFLFNSYLVNCNLSLCFKIVQTCVKPGVLLKSRSLFGRLDADFTGQCLELEENLGNLEIRKRSLCLRLSVGCLLDSFICDKTLLEASPILGFITHQTKLSLVKGGVSGTETPKIQALPKLG